MGDIVNLRREKKRRAKAEAAQTAAENRVRFGRDAAAKANDARLREHHVSRLDGTSLQQDSIATSGIEAGDLS